MELAGTVAVAVPVQLARTVAVAVAVGVAGPGWDVQLQVVARGPAAARMIRLRGDREVARRLGCLRAGPDGAETGQLRLQTVSVGRLKPAASHSHCQAGNGGDGDDAESLADGHAGDQGQVRSYCEHGFV